MKKAMDGDAYGESYHGFFVLTLRCRGIGEIATAMECRFNGRGEKVGKDLQVQGFHIYEQGSERE